MKVTTTKNAFTMIELIFVIVILGILAAVAIPKLSATRTDAIVSKMATNLNTIISDAGSYYTSKGTLDKWNTITNVQTNTDATTKTVDTTIITTPVYLYHDTFQCIKLVGIEDGNLTISKGSDSSDSVCSAVQASQKANLRTYKFGGSSVVY